MHSMQSGHVLIGNDGRLIGLDQAFCDIMHADLVSLIGRRVSDVTAPADRAECDMAIAKLRETRRPFRISKRIVRDNGSLVWVTNSVSILADQRAPETSPETLVATIDPISDPTERRPPALLLDCARMLVSMRDDRRTVLDPSVFSDTAWDAILAAYIAEAEGRAIDAAALAMNLEISVDRAQRWIAILQGQNAIEIETRETDPYAPKSFRLTNQTHVRLEDHLSKAGQLQSAIATKSKSLQ